MTRIEPDDPRMEAIIALGTAMPTGVMPVIPALCAYYEQVLDNIGDHECNNSDCRIHPLQNMARQFLAYYGPNRLYFPDIAMRKEIGYLDVAIGIMIDERDEEPPEDMFESIKKFLEDQA